VALKERRVFFLTGKPQSLKNLSKFLVKLLIVFFSFIFFYFARCPAARLPVLAGAITFKTNIPAVNIAQAGALFASGASPLKNLIK
jgi:hypothetical protein